MYQALPDVVRVQLPVPLNGVKLDANMFYESNFFFPSTMCLLMELKPSDRFRCLRVDVRLRS